MRIGITVDIRHSMFSAGHPNSCLAICEVFQSGGHEVIFLRKDSGEWWDDVLSLKDIAKSVHVDQANVELVIEVGFFLSPLQRIQVSSKCIWYCRKSALFTDIESTVYASRPEGRDLEGLSEIWVADIFNNKDDLVFLETLYPLIPIKIVPWLWTPTIVEAHRKELGIPVLPQQNKDTKWSLHICETNMSNISCCAIPLVIVKNSGIEDSLSKLSIHNGEIIEKSKFFVENVKNHCLINKEAQFIGRQRLIEWALEPNSMILSHSRFIPLKQANLEAIWVGLPLIHNNTILRDLGNGVEDLYYSDNKIGEAAERIKKLIHEPSSIAYLSDKDALSKVRNIIVSRFSPSARRLEWLTHIEKIEPIVKSVRSSKYVSLEKKFHVIFTDMWSDFNVEHNTFILAIESALDDTEVKGYSLETLPLDLKPDVHIFGPFGSTWKTIDCPKIHFTGENTGPIDGVFNVGFQNIENPRYLRMPLWMFELDWFGADLNRIQNPLLLPIETCSSCLYLEYERKEFCAFIVSNPKNSIRNEAFHALNKYKEVKSAGRLFNTVGDELFAGLGGGGGELKKHEFLKNYRFCLAYENEMADGYVTEKLLHAKAAGCIPIYWGSSSAITDFDPRGFINASNCSMEEMVDLVKSVEEDPVKWKEMASIPLFTSETIDIVRGKFSKLVQHIVPNQTIPKLLGRRKTIIDKSPYFVTGVTLNFWPSLYKWLKSLESQRNNVFPELEARVYSGKDVPDSYIELFKKEFPFVSFLRFSVETPGFPDFWEPQHYAWKLWILKEVATESSLSGKLIFYMDCGSTLIRMPLEWIKQTLKSKICFLEDPGQFNERWCHEKFCEILNVSSEEKKEKQLIAGLVMFIAGESIVKRFFTEAYKIGCIRECIVGEKWVRMANGDIRGHRHDQSILSILSGRYKIHRYPLEKVYCDVSARATYYNGLSVYVHRGNYKTHIPFLEGIDETYVINLDRRPDRRTAFLEAHPDLKGKLRRHCAYDGLSLNLTPKLAALFKPNDFFWKKAIMGCSLSHLKLWTMLVAEPEEMNTYLILEDDVRFLPGWKEAWQGVYPNLPENWECIYLGGVLPPNKEGFKRVMEPVASCPGLSRIAPNTLFGQQEPVRQFHFCAYSYVLSRRAAKRILEVIELKGGIWTSADHLLFNSLDKENVYVLDPLVAGASQDDDPYINSDFNDFSRKDKFDSDLWNNDERFSLEEYSKCLENGNGLDIMGALNEIPIGNQVNTGIKN